MYDFKKIADYFLIFLLTIAIFVIDYLTYSEVMVAFLYIIPIFIASRILSKRSVILLSFICLVFSFIGIDFNHSSGSLIYLHRFFVILCMTTLSLLLVIRKESDKKLNEKEKNLEALLQMEKELNQLIMNQNNRLDTILSRIPGIVWESESSEDNPFEKITYLSQSFASFAGTKNSLLSKSAFWGDYIYPEDETRVKKDFTDILKNKRPGITEFRLCLSEERIIWVESHAKILHNENNEAIGLRGVLIDITEKKEYQTALIETEQRFRLLADTAPVLIWISDLARNCTYVNKKWLEFTGSSLSREIGKGWLRNLHSNDIDFFLDSFNSGIQSGSSFGQEFRLKRKDGQFRWMLNSGVPRYTSDGKLIGYIGSCVDITDRKESEMLLSSSLREKEILLKEIHHRVKNNLQIISSILNLQSDFIEDPKALELFMESKNRIRSMALIHEKLYRSKNFNYLNFEEYVRDIVQNLLSSYRVLTGPVTPVIDFDDSFLDIDCSIILGLILNEIVSNSLKYAFTRKNSHKNELYISLKNIDEDGVIFIIKDNGVGFPSDVDFRNSNSLGLQLVNSLVEQLNGEIELTSEGGTQFKMYFKGLVQKKHAPNAVLV